jgi:hypothetical protein
LVQPDTALKLAAPRLNPHLSSSDSITSCPHEEIFVGKKLILHPLADWEAVLDLPKVKPEPGSAEEKAEGQENQSSE